MRGVCLVGGQVFVPPIKEVPTPDFNVHEYWWGRFGYLFVTLVFGWPAYLVVNVTGRPYSRWANHFDPYSPIFSKRERVEVPLLRLAPPRPLPLLPIEEFQVGVKRHHVAGYVSPIWWRRPCTRLHGSKVQAARS